MDTETADMSERKSKVTEKLQRRHDGRIAEMESKREEQDVDLSKKTSIGYFYKTFQDEISSIEKHVSDLSKPDSGHSKVELTEGFDSQTLRVKKLQKFVADYVSVLPNYDILRSQASTRDLLSAIQIKRDEMIPKKKFAFRSRKKESGNSVVEISSDGIKDSKDHNRVIENLLLEDSKGFSDKSSETLQMSADDIRLQDVSLSNLTSCKVILQGYPSAVHVNNLKECKVFCGPVPGSVFIDNCDNCVFAIACQQLRVHHTKNTQFYLHVTSRAIIEDTSSVLFAPYNWEYPGKVEDYAESGLDEKRNNWDDVDDFNWLAIDKHSPNWGILRESERVQKWD